jgi:hypothetical protein
MFMGDDDFYVDLTLHTHYNIYHYYVESTVNYDVRKYGEFGSIRLKELSNEIVSSISLNHVYDRILKEVSKTGVKNIDFVHVSLKGKTSRKNPERYIINIKVKITLLDFDGTTVCRKYCYSQKIDE